MTRVFWRFEDLWHSYQPASNLFGGALRPPKKFSAMFGAHLSYLARSSSALLHKQRDRVAALIGLSSVELEAYRKLMKWMSVFPKRACAGLHGVPKTSGAAKVF